MGLISRVSSRTYRDKKMAKLGLLAASILWATASADTPANCMAEDIYGVWDFHIGEATDKVSCENWSIENTNTVYSINLRFPNIADVIAPENAESGFWTMIYNEGFEVNVGTHSFFAFVWYEGKDFRCTDTKPGYLSFWAGKERRCFIAIKRNQSNNVFSVRRTEKHPVSNNLEKPFEVDHDLVSKINSIPGLSWTADSYASLWNETMTIRQAKKYQGPFTQEKSLFRHQKDEKNIQETPILEQKMDKTLEEKGYLGDWRKISEHVPDEWDS